MVHTLSYLLHALVVLSVSLILTIDAADPLFLVPTASTAARSVSEDETATTPILILEGQDTDGDPLTFSIVTQDPTSPPFELETVTGLLKVPSGLDAEVSTNYTFVFGVRDGSTTTNSVPYVVNILDVNDNAPVFNPTTYVNTVSESDPIGTSVGRVTATDADVSGNTITFSIVAGDSPASFALDQNTGEITVSATLDANTNPSYSLTIQASDGTNNATTPANVTITITGDKCASFPCQNGGTCNNVQNSYTCTCADGYTGTNCGTTTSTTTTGGEGNETRSKCKEGCYIPIIVGCLIFVGVMVGFLLLRM